jgi:DNA-binding NarL/FixJ family response regulator
MKPYRIVLADDHTILRQGIRRLVEEIPGVQVLGEANDGMELLALLSRHATDLVIVDITMPGIGGIEATREIRKLYPHTKILILTMHKRIEYLHHAIAAGADGYLLKEDSNDELSAAITAIRKGRRYITQSLSSDMADYFARLRNNEWQELRAPITVREQGILTLIAQGKSSKEIAALLGISLRTVQNHRANMMQKLGVKKTADLVKYAVDKCYI